MRCFGCGLAGLEELQVIADCIGGHALASVCRLLAEDHTGWGGAHALLPLAVSLALQHLCSMRQFC